MRLADLLILPLAALWQQKLRTILTTLGVVFGAFVLAASLSIGEGVQQTIDRESRRIDISRRVEVYPKRIPAPERADKESVKLNGQMTSERQARLRQSLEEQKPQPARAQITNELTPDRLKAIAALPNIERLVPLVQNSGFVALGKKFEGVRILSARPDDAEVRRRIVTGRFFTAPDQRAVVVSELLVYRLGLVNDADVESLIGKTVVLAFRIPKSPTSPAKPALARPEVYTEEFPVVGVIRKPTDAERKAPWDPLRVEADVLLPYQTALDLCFRRPEPEPQGVKVAVLLVNAEKNVKDLARRIEALGFDVKAPIESIEQEQLIYLLIFSAMTCVAVVALLVSALGIANTMLMSVLERTREIGIMKAVGADNRHLQFVFLVEGALIGLVGAGIGLLLAWSLSYPGDAWVHAMVMRELKVNLKGSIFAFGPGMAVTVVLFTVLVTTLAAVYPARHAARVDPVAALRHE